MPLYEYECTSCHRRTEKIQKFSDPELTLCPHCGGPLERTITAAAVSFKGGGWYKDGYASAKPSSSSEGSSSSDNSGNDSSATKVESVSAAASSGDAPKSGDAAKSSDSAKPAAAATPAAPASAPSAPAKA
jgi:putative FmdB family regulatory protein